MCRAVLWMEPVPGDAASIRLGASVQTPTGAWRTVVSDTSLPIHQWHTAALVLDDDVLAVVDETAGTLLAAAALPEASLAPASGTSLSVGTLPDGVGYPFTGDVAAVSWTDEPPTAFDPLVDGWRVSAVGVIDAKRWSLLPRFDVGAPLGKPEWDSASQCVVRRFAGADIRFSEDISAAFEIHGAIRDEYNLLTYRALLGFPVSDEIGGTVPGVRKNLFSQGAVYWTLGTGAYPVFEEVYVAYESAGEAALLGAPAAAEEAVAGGLRQPFARGEIYLADGSATAFEAHGAILEKFHATGGLGRWGFPTTNELRIVRPGSGEDLGRYSDFAQGTVYWAPGIGAHLVYGDIADHYTKAGGPQGRLGFPTSDELDLPDAPGARYNTFQRGAIFWYPGIGATEPTPLNVVLGTVDTKEDEGWGRGQNDLTIDVGLLQDGTHIDGFQDVSDGQNIRQLNRPLGRRIDPWPGRVYTLRVDVHERDPEDRPRLGLWEKRLDAGNGWGMRENNGILNSGNFSMIKSITASVAPLPPPGGFSPAQKHWGTGNPKTARVSRNTFAKAFPEVDSEPEWWDIIDGFESIYFELVSKGLSEDGNCMGFSAEGILAEKGSSLYQLPLDRFKMADWRAGLEEHINVRHQSQVGATAIWWFVAMFLSGTTHNPVDVFRMTRGAHAAGQNPIICLAQNYDFSGAPHVVRPIAWREVGATWEIDVLDPIFPGGPRKITIVPAANTFSYIGGSTYTGGRWSGGRLYFLPFHSFSGTAELPFWDALRLLLGGTITILGEGDAATAVSTPDGENLLLAGEPTASSRIGSGPNGFVPVPYYEREIDPDDEARLGRGPFEEPQQKRPRAGRKRVEEQLVGRGRVDVPDDRPGRGGVQGQRFDGVRFGELLAPHVAARVAVASGVLARARREPSLYRRRPRGGHRRLRDELGGLDITDVVVERRRPLREELAEQFDPARLGFDTRPLVVRGRAQREAREEPHEPAAGAEEVRDLSGLRIELATLAARLPEGEQRAALIELATDAAPLDHLADDRFRQRFDKDLDREVVGIAKSLYSDDFVLDTISLGRHGGRIAIVHALRKYVVGHDGAVGSALRIAGQNLRTTANTLSVAPGTGRRVNLSVTNRLGLRGDLVRARFLDLPAESAAPLTINVRPGLARWELVGDALEGPAQAVVSGVIGGQRFGAVYDLTLKSSLRIQLPLATDAARLSVATTNGLFADAVEVTKLAPR